MFRVEEGRRFYLLVTASSNATEWVLPKGTIKKDETPEQAAIREVREEAGVRAESLGPIDELQGSGDKLIRYFLMRYLWDVEQMERRSRDYWPYDEAITIASRPDVRAALEAAEERARDLDRKEAAANDYTRTLHQQLDLIRGRQRETERFAHGFLGVFGFGTVLAMLALIRGHGPISTPSLAILAVLGGAYAYLVALRYGGYRRTLFELGYHADLTVRARLTGSRPDQYARWLSARLDGPDQPRADTGGAAPEEAGFDLEAKALLDDHRRRWRRELDGFFRGGRWPFSITSALWLFGLAAVHF